MSQADPLRNATLPRLLLRLAQERGQRPAMREKHRGIWRVWSWQELGRNTRHIAAGLRARGFSRGDRLIVLGDNRPRLYWSLCAAQMLGGIPIPLSGETPADAIDRVIRAHGVRFAIAGTAGHGRRIAEASARHAERLLIFLDDAGAEPGGQAETGLMALDQLVAAGQAADESSRADLDREIDSGLPADTAALLPFGRITLGSPDSAWSGMQAASQTHAQAIAWARTQVEAHRLGDSEEILAHLPLGSHADHHFCHVLGLAGGVTVNMPESQETVPIDTREIGPTLHVLPDWALAQIRSRVLRGANDVNFAIRHLFRLYVGDDTAGARKTRSPDIIGRLLILRPLRDLLGLGRTRILFVEGAGATSEGLRFFRNLDLSLVNVDSWDAAPRSDAEPAAASPSIFPIPDAGSTP